MVNIRKKERTIGKRTFKINVSKRKKEEILTSYKTDGETIIYV